MSWNVNDDSLDLKINKRFNRIIIEVTCRVCVRVTCASIDDAVYQRLTVWHWRVVVLVGGTPNTIRRQHLAWTIYFSGRPSASSSCIAAARGGVCNLLHIPITGRVSRWWMLGSYIMCKHARNFWQVGRYIFTPFPL